MAMKKFSLPLLALGCVLVLLLGGAAWSSFKTAKVIPAPQVNLSPTQPGQQTAIFAGGCFWGMEAIFEHLRGVTQVQTGYAGGAAHTATYAQVSTGTTGHAEGIQVTYDPQQISYAQLLQVYFGVAHDPTQVNRQGVDVGNQYRSAIFATTPEQATMAQAYIDQLTKAQVFDRAIATQVNPPAEFYPAETYHQDFVKKHPLHPYVVVHDLPKIERFKQDFAQWYQP